MIILICGSRDWLNKDIIKQEILKFNNIEKIIHGGCRGADILGGLVAKDLNIPVQVFEANWNLHGKSAGPKRNQQMIDEGEPNFVLAFHDNINESKGTKDMINRTVKHKIDYKIISKI
jgi:hypothetical protein